MLPIGQTGLAVRVIREIADVESVRSVWMSWQRHPNSDIDFYLKVLAKRTEFIRPHVVLVYRDGTPEALLLGRIEKRPFEFRIGYKTVFSCRLSCLAIGYGGVLGSPSNESSLLVARELLDALSRHEARVAFFNHLRTDSSMYSALVGISGRLTRDYFPSLQTHRCLVLPRGSGNLYAAISPKSRHNLRRTVKKFTEAFGAQIGIECLDGRTHLSRILRDVEFIAKQTYQRRLGLGLSTATAMSDQLRFLAQAGWLRTYILYLDGTPCAFWVGSVYRDTFHSESMGYDPAYSKHSPGMYLTMKVLESLCDRYETREINDIDFGLGDAQYKAVLGTNQWLDASAYLFASTLPGIGLCLLRTLFMAGDRAARYLLSQVNLLRRIKKAWRGGMGLRQLASTPGDDG